MRGSRIPGRLGEKLHVPPALPGFSNRTRVVNVTNERNTTSRTRGSKIRLALLGVLAAVVGLYGSAFGPFYTATIGTVLLIIGAVEVARRRRRGQVFLVIGGGIVTGAIIYVALGVLGPNEPAFQSGTGCWAPSGEVCANEVERD